MTSGGLEEQVVIPVVVQGMSESSPLDEAKFPITIFTMWCVYHMAWYTPNLVGSADTSYACRPTPEAVLFPLVLYYQVLVLPVRLPTYFSVQEETTRAQHSLRQVRAQKRPPLFLHAVC